MGARPRSQARLPAAQLLASPHASTAWASALLHSSPQAVAVFTTLIAMENEPEVEFLAPGHSLRERLNPDVSSPGLDPKSCLFSGGCSALQLGRRVIFIPR